MAPSPRHSLKRKQSASFDVGSSDQPITEKVDADRRPWAKFVSAHPSFSKAGDDAIYALPTGLIDILETIPLGILNRKDLQLERDLANLAGLGFVFRRPIVFHDLGELHRVGRLGNSMKIEPKHRAIDQHIRELEAFELAKEGRSRAEIQSYFATCERLDAKITERGMGYCGWLATHAVFRKDRDHFRKKWEARIADVQCFPVYPTTDFAGKEPNVAKEDREYYVDYLRFYRRWCIHTFATWDLPIPMRSDIVTPSMYSQSSIDEAGVTMFVPWHLLRNKDITLREIAELKGVPTSLRPWVDGERKNWGTARSILLLEIYYYTVLVLRQRYSERLRGKWTRVDDAIGRYLRERSGTKDSDDESFFESVKKVRQELGRRLK